MAKVRLESLCKGNLDIESRCCMESSPDLLKHSKAKKKWLVSMMAKGLRGQLIFEDDLNAGFIEYQPIELPPCPAIGKDLYFINCIMVRWGDFGSGNMKGKGYGRMLVDAAEADLRKNTQTKGLVAWGLDHEFSFMPYSFFQHLGYEVADQEDQRVLLVKKFGEVESPYLRPVSFSREVEPGKAVVDFFYSGQCPFRAYQLERWRRVCQEFDEQVVFNEYLTDKPSVISTYGVKAGIFLNGEEVVAGPMTEEEIRDKVASAIRHSSDSFDWLD